MEKGMFNLEYYSNVKNVQILDSEDGIYNGAIARVLNVVEHKFGIDLRVILKSGQAFWISSDSIVEYDK